MRKAVELIQKQRWTLRWKLLGSFGLTNLLLTLALLFTLLALFGTTFALAKLKATTERSQNLARLEVLEGQMVERALDYLWSDNISRLKEYEAVRSNLQISLNNFLPASEQVENFNQLKTASSSLRQSLDQLTQLAVNNPTQQQEIITRWRTQVSKEAAQVRTSIQELNEQDQRLQTITYRETTALLEGALWVAAGLALLAIGLAIVLALILTTAFTQPIHDLSSHLNRLAAGDLTGQVQLINRDELGELGQIYNRTVSSLQTLVQQLHTQSRQLGLATQELNSQATTMVAGSVQQDSAVAEISQAIAEMNQTTTSIAGQALDASQAVQLSVERSQAVSQLTNQLVQTYHAGRDTVARTMENLSDLKEQMDAISKEHHALLVQSKVISSVVELIDEIAGETHLLALNAAIEAAGAGEHGNRFGVIAQEVRNLADRCAKATNEVRTALEGITNAAEAATQKTEQGTQQAQSAVAEANHSDEALVAMTVLSEQVQVAVAEIADQAKNTALLTGNIGANTYQQQTTSKQMLEKILQIETITTQNLSSIRQGETAIQQLNETAQRLQSSASAFRLAAIISAAA